MHSIQRMFKKYKKFYSCHQMVSFGRIEKTFTFCICSNRVTVLIRTARCKVLSVHFASLGENIAWHQTPYWEKKAKNEVTEQKNRRANSEPIFGSRRLLFSPFSVPYCRAWSHWANGKQKFRTGKFRPGITFTICTKQFYLPKNGSEEMA